MVVERKPPVPGPRLVDNSVINICRHLSTHIKVKTSGKQIDSEVAHNNILHYQVVCVKLIFIMRKQTKKSS